MVISDEGIDGCMTLEEIRRRKQDLGYTNEQIAEKSGVPLATVQKVLGGTTKSPRYQTIQALAKAFSKESPYEALPREGQSGGSVIREPGAAYDVRAVGTGSDDLPEEKRHYVRQGSYTLKEYLALPDDQRVELIDGVFYDMAAPAWIHQLIAGEIYGQLREFIKRKSGSCVPFMAPTDVQLDRDERTVVQPDVFVICDRSKLENRQRVFGEPDFVVEVLSPSTKIKDILIKMRKYQQAGVREYWMVDPDKLSITKVVFMKPGGEYKDGDLRMETWPFKSAVPVEIFEGECVVDFADVMERYPFAFGE